MRKTSAAPMDAATALAHLEEESGDTALRYGCTLVTPMYGGGVAAGIVDTKMPIRATAIRGQLREWWRRLNLKRFANDRGKVDHQALFAAERAIWGGLGDAESLASSKVVVRVHAKPDEPARLQRAATYTQAGGKLRGPDFGKYPGYALFPAQGKSERGRVPEAELLLREGFTFDLVVQFKDRLAESQQAQVLEAVRWWATFGGVGARTRRGCGSLEVKDQQGKIVVVSEREVNELGFRLVLGNPCANALDAWRHAIEALRDFRQKEGLGRNKGQQGRPGRSKWPEPDAIRRLTRENAEQHKPEHPAGNVFPRAAFGLPIITHFKQEREWRRQDPQDTTLKPDLKGNGEAAERMASPLIMCPYHDGMRWRPAALRLDMAHIERMGLVLEGKSRRLPARLSAGEWQPDIQASEKIEPLEGSASAIEAFLSYFGNALSNMPGNAGTVAKIKTYQRPNISKRAGKIVVEPKGQASRDLVGDAAKRLYDDLSVYARGRLDAGKQFNRLEITFDGHEYVSLKEYEE